jgi:anti-anti-sigma factor
MSDLMLTIDTRAPGTAVVFMQGSADIAGHDYFKAEMAKAHTDPAKNVVLDIRQLNFLTSLAVGEMIALAKVKKQAGGRVAIAGPNNYVLGVFEKARISAVIPIYATVDEALAAVKGS